MQFKENRLAFLAKTYSVKTSSGGTRTFKSKAEADRANKVSGQTDRKITVNTSSDKVTPPKTVPTATPSNATPTKAELVARIDAGDNAAVSEYNRLYARKVTPTTKTEPTTVDYKTNPEAGNAEIEKIKSEWTAAAAKGDTATADALHAKANAIRDAMGLAGTYDPKTGATLTTKTTPATPTEETPAYDFAADKTALEAATTEYEKKIKEMTETYKENQDIMVQQAKDNYAAQQKNLKKLQDAQEKLTEQQNALVETSDEVQREELSNAYKTNTAAVEAQQKKAAQAYETMQEEQELLNKQTKIKAETSLGLIYGFGSVAGNKNIEDTVMKGERTLIDLKKEAVNADIDFQNQALELTRTYTSDLNKVEQWKAEEIQQNYVELQKYIAEISSDMTMALTEKNTAITNAITQYNEKVAETSATVAETKYNLSLKLIEMANEYKVKGKETATADVENLVKAYSTEDYADLPSDVKAKLTQLSTDMGMPSSYGKNLFESYKASQEEAGKTKGVTAPKKSWSLKENDNGEMERFDSVSGKFASEFEGSFGSPDDALAVPDDTLGGQCGEFVNNYTGLGLGDPYDSKRDKIDWSITYPEPGDVFIMPIDGSSNGHAGFVVRVNGDKVLVKDSNWGEDELVQTHEIPMSSIEGYARVGGGMPSNLSASFASGATEGGTTEGTSGSEEKSIY